MYIHNIVSRPLRRVKELKGFKKVFPQPGKTKAVTIVSTKDERCSYNEKLEKVVLPVACQIMIESASDDIRLQTATINNIFSEPL